MSWSTPQGPDGARALRSFLSVYVTPMPSGINGTRPNPTATSLPPSNVLLNLGTESSLSAVAEVTTGTQLVAELSGTSTANRTRMLQITRPRSTGATAAAGTREK